MSSSRITICSVVRDCGKNLRRNIKKIEKLREKFLESEVVIFENDSKDNTLTILNNWSQRSKNVNILTASYNITTIPKDTNVENPYFSRYRIEKMSFYRNKYLEVINRNDFPRDYVLIIDLDISNFSLKGIAHSFGVPSDWSCITANGTSLSKRLTRQYHDSYALIEQGNINHVQKEETIEHNRSRFSFLKNGMPLFPVASAFGGLAIYKWSSLKGKYYSCIPNGNSRVGVFCEHVSINIQLDGNIYINPYMKVKYRSVDFSFLMKYVTEGISLKLFQSRQKQSMAH